jgi:hypothetical protein
MTQGSGAMETNIETFIARRFKRRGIRRTRRGTHRLLKVRLWIFRHGDHWSEALDARSTQLTDA